MVVSQRPSEVSETIFAQCNNFVTLKLTNQNDQSYIKIYYLTIQILLLIYYLL